MNNAKTFRGIIDANGGNAPEFTINLIDYTGRSEDEGQTISASCWTDDPAVLDEDACFTVDASWQRDGGIGRFDNLHGELDTAIMALINQITAKFGGEWRYDAPNCTIEQMDA